MVVTVPLLDDHVGVIDVTDFIGSIPDPGSLVPGVFLPHSTPHFTVIDEVAPPGVGYPNAHKLVFVVISKIPLAIREKIAVEVIRKVGG